MRLTKEGHEATRDDEVTNTLDTDCVGYTPDAAIQRRLWTTTWLGRKYSAVQSLQRGTEGPRRGSGDGARADASAHDALAHELTLWRTS